MRVLVACEESQRITIAMRALGHEAYSCDLEPCTGGHPEWHRQEDVLGGILQEPWDLVIAHPPCTYLTCTGNRWFDVERYGEKAIERARLREEAVDFFLEFTKLDHVPRVAIENPVGVMSTRYRKPDQKVHPWMFGDPIQKGTCWWLKGLPPLKPTNIVDPANDVYVYANGKTDSKWHMETMKLPAKERARVRSMTFPGMAEAIAAQWGGEA